MDDICYDICYVCQSVSVFVQYIQYFHRNGHLFLLLLNFLSFSRKCIFFPFWRSCLFFVLFSHKNQNQINTKNIHKLPLFLSLILSLSLTLSECLLLLFINNISLSLCVQKRERKISPRRITNKTKNHTTTFNHHRRSTTTTTTRFVSMS